MQCLCSILSLYFVNIGEAFTFNLEIECNVTFLIKFILNFSAEGVLNFM